MMAEDEGLGASEAASRNGAMGTRAQAEVEDHMGIGLERMNNFKKKLI